MSQGITRTSNLHDNTRKKRRLAKEKKSLSKRAGKFMGGFNKGATVFSTRV